MHLFNAYPEETHMIIGTTAWIWWHTGTKETTHIIQMKLHNKIMSTLETKGSRQIVISTSLTM